MLNARDIPDGSTVQNCEVTRNRISLFFIKDNSWTRNIYFVEKGDFRDINKTDTKNTQTKDEVL